MLGRADGGQKRAQGRQAKDRVRRRFLHTLLRRGTGEHRTIRIGRLCFLGQACKEKPAFVAYFSFSFHVRFSCLHLVLYYLFFFRSFREGPCKSKGGDREAVSKKEVREKGKGDIFVLGAGRYKTQIFSVLFMVGSLYLCGLEEVVSSFLHLAIKSIRSFFVIFFFFFVFFHFTYVVWTFQSPSGYSAMRCQRVARKTCL